MVREFEEKSEEISRTVRSWWESSASNSILGEADEVRELNVEDEEVKEMIVEHLEYIAENYGEELQGVVKEVLLEEEETLKDIFQEK